MAIHTCVNQGDIKNPQHEHQTYAAVSKLEQKTGEKGCLMKVKFPQNLNHLNNVYVKPIIYI